MLWRFHDSCREQQLLSVPAGSIAHVGAIPIRDCRLLIEPLIFLVVLLACRAFSCRHGLADGLSDFFVV